MARSRKSKPFAVRLPVPLAEWVERYAKENAFTKTEVMEAAVQKLKSSEGRRFNGKKRTLLDTIKRAEDGSDSPSP
jgi:hypothetical protein